MAAVNAIGESPLSESIEALSAQEPFQPLAPSKKSASAGSIEI